MCATAACMWVLPALVKMATREPQEYPFVYYGSVLKGFGLVDYKNKEMPLTDLDGNRYTAEQFDSLMPLLNYRQLMSDGRLPDSIGGREVTPPLLRMSTVIFRYKPEEVSAPESGLYILQESMPVGRPLYSAGRVPVARGNRVCRCRDQSGGREEKCPFPEGDGKSRFRLSGPVGGGESHDSQIV